MHTLPHRVSLIGASDDPTALVAMDVAFEHRTIRWFDTVKERVMTVARIVDWNPEHFAFERAAEEGGGTYTFVPMTLDRYRAHVRNRLLAKREFDTEEEMLAALEGTRAGAW